MCPRHHVKLHVPSKHSGFFTSIFGGQKVVLCATFLPLEVDVPNFLEVERNISSGILESLSSIEHEELI